MSSLLRSCLAAVFAALWLSAVSPAMAQGSDTKAADKPGDKPAAGQPVDADAQRRAEEFAEAARQVSGPAGNAECVFLGRNVVGLLFRNDMDTAFRHLDLYDRFGCPGPHIQSAFRCVLRQTASIDPKTPRSLTERVQSCWINPVSTTAAASTPAAGTTAAAQPAASAGSQGGSSGGAAAASAGNQQPAAKPAGTPAR